MRRIVLLLAALACVAASPSRHKSEWTGARPWVTQAQGIPATVDLDFADGRYWPPLALNNITTTRASIGTCPGPDGTYYQFPNNQPRITAAGICVEEARTNSLRNSTMAGAATGTPGTQPTNWALTGATGLTTTVASLTTQSGLSCIDETLSGTTGSTSAALSMEATTQIAATYGQTWTASFFDGLSGGSLTNVTSVTDVIQNLTSGGASIAQNTVSTPVPTSTLTRTSGSLTLTGSTTAFVRQQIVLNWSTSVAVNLTLRICQPQLENNTLINSTVASATTNASGTGGTNGTAVYSVGGGTCSTTPTLNVTWSSGTLSVNSVANAGSCTVFPPSPATLTYVSGTASGWTGASVNVVPTNNSTQGFATTPIPTSSAAVTRAADAITMPLPGGATAASGYGVLATGVPEAPTANTTSQYIANISDGTTSNRLQLARNGTNGNYLAAVTIAGANTNANTGTAWTQNTSAKVSGYTAANTVKAVINNGSVTSGAPTGGPPAVTTLGIGESSGGNSYFNGQITRIVIAPFSLLNN